MLQVAEGAPLFQDVKGFCVACCRMAELTYTNAPSVSWGEGSEVPGWHHVSRMEPKSTWDLRLDTWVCHPLRVYYIAFRGTELFNAVTWLGNVGYMLGHLPPMALHAETELERAMAALDASSPTASARSATAALRAIAPRFPERAGDAAEASGSSSDAAAAQFSRLYVATLDAHVVQETLATEGRARDATAAGKAAHVLDAATQRGADQLARAYSRGRLQAIAGGTDPSAPGGYRIVLGGHSIGAVVAEILAARHDFPVVSFESPGVGGILNEEEKTVLQGRAVGFLGAPHLVNTVHEHVGSYFHIPMRWVHGPWSTATHLMRSFAGSVLRTATAVSAVAAVAAIGPVAVVSGVAAVAGGIAGPAVAGSAAVALLSSLASSGLVLDRQHHIGNMRQELERHKTPLLAVQSWPHAGAVIRNYSRHSLSPKVLRPLCGDNHGLHNLLNADGVYDKRVQKMDGFQVAKASDEDAVTRAVTHALRPPPALPADPAEAEGGKGKKKVKGLAAKGVELGLGLVVWGLLGSNVVKNGKLRKQQKSSQ